MTDRDPKDTIASIVAEAPAAEPAGDAPPPPKRRRRKAADNAAPPSPPGPDDESEGGSEPPGEPPGDVDWGLVRRCAPEDEDDVGNGRRLLASDREHILFIGQVGWHVYDGRRWKEDETGAEIRRIAHQAAERIRLEAFVLDATPAEQAAMEAGAEALKVPAKSRTPEEIVLAEAAKDAEKSLAARKSRRLRWKKTSSNSGKLDAMCREAAPYVTAAVAELDAEPLALNVENGTLRLVGEADPECPDPEVERLVWRVDLDPHRRGDLISKLMPVAYAPGAASPQFDAFLKRILPDGEVRAFVQRFLGYCLTARTSEQVFAFLWGHGRNGKSTLVDLVCRIMGDYATTVPFESLAGDDRRKGSDATPDLARLPGARLVRSTEPEQKMRFREATVKTLTSSEPILVRRLHQDFIEVYPTFTLIVSGNHKPIIEGTDDGIWRRVLLVPFNVQIPEEEVDRALPEALWAERAGIFNWLLAGLLDYLGRGLDPPAAVRAATEEYREESDPVSAWLRGGCEITGNPSDIETPLELFRSYEFYGRREGLFVFNQATFTRRLPDKTRHFWPTPQGGVAQFTKVKTGGNTVYRGIRIKDDCRPSRIPDDRGDEGW